MAKTQQVCLIPAGCQPWNINVATASGRRFAYASTLAVYIYEWNKKTNQFYLHSIMSEHKKTVTAVAFHPSDEEILASSGSDVQICVWHVSLHRLISVLNKPFAVPALLVWLPSESNCLAYCDGKGPIHLWRFKNKHADPTTDAQTIKDLPAVSSPITQISWHHSTFEHLALGHADGSISLSVCGQKWQHHVKLTHPSDVDSNDKQLSITTLLWDPFSPNYLLVSSGSGYIRLVDTTSKPVTVITSYTPPSKAVSIRCAAWLTEAPGVFVSGDTEAGILRIWAVSKEKPIESIQLKQVGFQALCVMPARNLMLGNKCDSGSGNKVMKFSARIVCLFSDGGIGVYSLKLSAWEFFRDMGHLETIFDCQFKPDNCDLLATGSFDGTIKVWDVNTMEPVYSSPGDESIIYSVSWAPSNVNCLAASTSKRGLIIWNIKKGSITVRIDDHGKGVYVYCVSWNPKDSRKIASGGADATCMIHQSDGKLLNTFIHPGTVFGCDWNPKNETIIATGCEDGNVRIFYDGSGTNQPLKTLQGHAGKVFRVKWSPLLEGMLCSTSDDCTVRIWDYASGLAVRVLQGHINYTRGVLWSTELPNVLISGSWDYSIRVWDISNGACLDVIEDHGADVYGLASHSSRPFMLVSTSRDSTVRLWSLLPLVSSLYLKALVNRPWAEIFPPSDVKKMCHGVLGMFGTYSSTVKDFLCKFENHTNLQTLRSLSCLFCPPSGVLNLWNLVAVLKGEECDTNSYKNGMVHRSHILKFAIAEAHEKELVKMTRFGSGGIGAPSKEECLRASADRYLLTGNLKKYCELKAELGEWKDALAVAPGISLNYWQELCSRWINVLMETNNNQLVPLTVATGKIDQLLTFFKKQNHLDRASLIIIAASEGLIKPLSTSIQANGNSDTISLPIDYEEMIKENAYRQTQQYFFGGSPVVAACCQLAVNNVQEALYALLRGNELELAVSVALSLDYKGPSLLSAVTYLAWRCVRKEEWELAIDILNICPDTELQKIQICASCNLSLAERHQLHLKAGLPTVDSCFKEATSAEKEGESVLNVVKFFLLSPEPKKGLDVGLDFVKKSLQDFSWKLEQIFEILCLLSSVNARVLQDNSCDRHRIELQIYCAYVGAFVALRQGYLPVVEALLQKTLVLIRRIQNLNLSITEKEVEEQLHAWIQSQQGNLTDDFRDIFQQMNSKAFEVAPFGDIGITFVSGSHLPRHSDHHNCYLRGSAIQGPVFFLEDCKSVISLNDALMWGKVNRFSPLGSGLCFNPF